MRYISGGAVKLVIDSQEILCGRFVLKVLNIIDAPTTFDDATSKDLVANIQSQKMEKKLQQSIDYRGYIKMMIICISGNLSELNHVAKGAKHISDHMAHTVNTRNPI